MKNYIDQEELDLLLKQWADSLFKEYDAIASGCQHETQTYIGFSEQYEFCIKCDAKKINGQWKLKDELVSTPTLHML